MAFNYGQQLDANGVPIGNGTFSVKSTPKVSIPIIIEDLRALKDDNIATPTVHSHSMEVRLATNNGVNIALTGLQIIDGVQTVDGDLILVKDQTDGTQNGVYIAHDGAWVRNQLMAIFNNIKEGSLNSGRLLFLTTSDNIVLGTSLIVYADSVGSQGLGQGTGIVINNNLIAIAPTGVNTGIYSRVVVNAEGQVVSGSNPTTVADIGITDAYTKTAVDSNIATALTIAKAYSDANDATNLGTLETYSDVNIASSLATAKAYTDTNLVTAKAYTDTNLTTAKEYSDTNLVTAKGYSDTKIAALVASSPTTLDTLKELADALGDDANFSTTMTTLIGTKANQSTTYSITQMDTSLALKAPLASPLLTGSPMINGVAPVVVTDSRLSDARTPVAHSQAWSTITATPTNLAGYGVSSGDTLFASVIAGNATKLLNARTIATSGDAVGTITFDGSANVTIPLVLANSGVSAGSYSQVTVNAKGLVTGGANPVITSVDTITTGVWNGSAVPTTNGGTGATTAVGALSNLGAVPLAGGTLTGNLGMTSASLSGQLTSTVAVGTAPMVVTSTTKVTNLNADLLDGMDTASTNVVSTIVSRDVNGSSQFNDPVNAMDVVNKEYCDSNAIISTLIFS